MNGAGDRIDRISPTRRPDRTAIGYQNWRELLFVHWRVPADAMRPLVPRGLTIDTFDGSAWVGLVPFRIFGVRPRFVPPVPVLSRLLEANLRTYVHLDGRDPGVWFFSLDASNLPAVITARWLFLLPYFRSWMRMQRSGDRYRHSSRRIVPGPFGAGYRVEAELGEALPTEYAPPGTLEHFLIERYILYAAGSGGRLYQGRVHHPPYPLRQARLIEQQQTVLYAHGIEPPAGPEHVVFSEGVDVEIFALEKVAG